MANLAEFIRHNIMCFPDRIALVTGDGNITYGQLGQQITALGQRLPAERAGPETITAICTRQPAMAIAAVLAVWSAGGAYLPLDPDFPGETLRHWVTSAGASLIITDEPAETHRLTAMDIPGVEVIHAELAAAEPLTSYPEIPAGDPRNLAYVMFTSGSTGIPKAVAVEHQSVQAYFTDALPSYVDIGPGDVVLQLAAFTFDPWLRDAIMPLSRGASVVLLPKPDRRDPGRVLAALREHRITHLLSATPAMLSGLLTMPSFAASPLSLQWTLVSGESFLPLHAHGPLLHRLGRLVNHFGLTETTLIATRYEVTAARDTSADVIGWPVPGVTVHVLDADLRQVGPGQPGELYIGGTGVSRGYLGAPALTAERYIANPFGSGDRLYRTGDLARIRPDGSLEYLGRADRQISLRGHRIEPAEVELAITTHPAVSSAMVVRHDRQVQGAILVAYAAVRHSALSGTEELRSFLAERLPAHMIPSVFVLMDALPMGPTGKVDRSALPEPVVRRDNPPDRLTPAGQRIARAWSAALGIGRVGGADNFFDLGGHSLLAAQIAAALRADLGLDFTADHVMRHPTVADLAANLPAAPSDINPVISRHRRSYPLSLVQRGLASGASGGRLGPAGDPACAFRVAGQLDTGRLRRAVAELMRRHPTLRTTFTLPDDGEPDQIVRHRMHVPLRAQASTEEDVAGQVTAARMRPFDIVNGPLFEVVIFSLCTAEQIVLMRFSRLVADQSSLDIFTRELSDCYRTGARPGSAPAVSAMTYPQFAQRQHDSLTPGQLAATVASWQNLLPGAGLAPAARPHTDNAGGGSWRLALPPAAVRPLHALARAYGAGFSRVLEAAYGVSLALAYGQENVLFAAATTDRPGPELYSVIGPFTYSRPVLVSLEGVPVFSKLLERLRDLDQMSRRSPVPLEFLQAELGFTRPASAAALVLRPAAPEPLRLSGSEAEPLDLPVITEPEGLCLSLTEHVGGLQGRLDSGAACPCDVRMVADRLTRLLTSVAESPHLPIPGCGGRDSRDA